MYYKKKKRDETFLLCRGIFLFKKMSIDMQKKLSRLKVESVCSRGVPDDQQIPWEEYTMHLYIVDPENFHH